MAVTVGVPSETAPGETRVALTPPVAERLVESGHEILVAAGAGEGSDWRDDDYREAGCTVLDARNDVFAGADVVLQVRALGANPERRDPYREGQVVVGLLEPYAMTEADFDRLVERRVSAFALERVPRTTRAQSMDVLTSQASVAGYKAAVLAADSLPALFPLQMTAAGTVRPAEVFVVGAGVAGLQAIATAKRLGARVRAYDVRPEVREEVESLGASFVELGLDIDERGGTYARERDAAFYDRQREVMTETVADADVVITAAAVPGKPAPTLLSAAMVEGMDAGSVVVDLGADSGGNCAVTEPGETVEYEGVTVHGPRDLPCRVSHTASQLYATNLRNVLDLLLNGGALEIDTADDIVNAMLLTHAGERWDERDGGESATRPADSNADGGR